MDSPYRKLSDSLTVDTQKSVTQVLPQNIVIKLILASTLGFLINCLPSRNFLEQYLEENKSVHTDEVFTCFDVSFVIFSSLVAFFADSNGFRLTIFAGILTYQLSRFLILFLTGVIWMSVTQLLNAAAMSTNAVYFGYVFVLVSPQFYKLASSLVLASFHFGNAFGSLLGQVAVDYTFVGNNIMYLFYMSWGFAILALISFLTVLPIENPTSKYMRQQAPQSFYSFFQTYGMEHALTEIRVLYRDFMVQIWTIWFVFGFSAQHIALQHFRGQLESIDPNVSYGYFECEIQFLAALSAMCSHYFYFKRRQVQFIIFTSLLQGVLYYSSTVLISSKYYSLAFNTVAICIFSFQNALAMSTIARNIPSPRFSFIFPMNTSAAMFMATLISQIMLRFDQPRKEFFWAACLCQFVGVFMVLFWVILTPEGDPGYLILINVANSELSETWEDTDTCEYNPTEIGVSIQ